jgi:hypothetical protein
LLAIDPVRLRSPSPLLHRNARGIEHMVGNPRRSQQAMQPKSVIARFVATHYRRRRAQRQRRPLAHPLDQRQQTNMVAAIKLVHIRSRSGLHIVTSQVLWLSSSATNIVPLLPLMGVPTLDVCI